MASPEEWDVVVRRDVRRDAPGSAEVRETRPPRLPAGGARLAVERFGLTANNVTYARLGEKAHYWTAFPAPAGYGRVPAWGFAVVEASDHPGVAVGQRYFGLLPMSNHLVVAPETTPTGFVDAAPHRATLHDFYRRYRRVGPLEDRDGARTVLRSVYPASFVLAELVARALGDGGGTVVVSSASSKTALGLADRLVDRFGIPAHGLTSAGHRRFVTGTGTFDAVSPYDEVGSLDADGPLVFVDLAGDGRLTSAVHRRFSDRLALSVRVGATHPAGLPAPSRLPGPEPVRFFAPDVEDRRRAELGAENHDAEYAAAEDAFVARAGGWLSVEEHRGPRAVADVFAALASGSIEPGLAHVMRP